MLATDDVYLLQFQSGQTLQVDGTVFDSVRVGETISKTAWSNQLAVNGRTVELEWSADLLGMIWAMPAILIVLGVTGVISTLQPSKRKRNVNRSHSCYYRFFLVVFRGLPLLHHAGLAFRSLYGNPLGSAI